MYTMQITTELEQGPGKSTEIHSVKKQKQKTKQKGCQMKELNKNRHLVKNKSDQCPCANAKKVVFLPQGAGQMAVGSNSSIADFD